MPGAREGSAAGHLTHQQAVGTGCQTHQSPGPLALAAGIKWSERSSYCQNIPYLADRPVYNPREQYLDFACVFPLTQIYNVSV